MPPFCLYNLFSNNSPDTQEYESAAISVVSNDSACYIVTGSLDGQLNISKVSAKDIIIILSVEIKQKIMAINTLLNSEGDLTLTVLTERTILRHSLQSDQGILLST